MLFFWNKTGQENFAEVSELEKGIRDIQVRTQEVRAVGARV